MSSTPSTPSAGHSPNTPGPTPEAQAIVVVFPGQGSQKPGMGKDFHDAFPIARQTFEEASSALDLDMRALCFDEDPRLDLTEFTQPAILTTEIAMIRVLREHFGLRPTHFGGHSLGEYTALCAASVLPLSAAVRIVRRRGALMQAAVPPGRGAMAAVLCPGIAERDFRELLVGLDVDVANKNARDQVVLSGDANDVATAEARVTQLLSAIDHQVIRLNVSAPFHSRLMRGIEPEFRRVLEANSDGFDAGNAARVTSNFTGRFHRPERGAIVDALVSQVSGAVDWIANMRVLIDAAPKIFEVGPGRPLGRFFKGEGRDVTSIVSVKTAEKGLSR